MPHTYLRQHKASIHTGQRHLHDPPDLRQINLHGTLTVGPSEDMEHVRILIRKSGTGERTAYFVRKILNLLLNCMDVMD